MKRQLIAVIAVVLLGFDVAFAVDERFELGLPVSGSLLLTTKESDSEIKYDLSLRRPQQEDRVIWSKTESRTYRNPSSWYALISCDEDAETVAVLFERNEVSLLLLQFHPNGGVIAEVPMQVPNFLRQWRLGNAGKLRVIAPNRIVLENGDQTVRSITVVGNTLIGDDGLEVQEGFRVSLGQSDATGVKPDAVSSASDDVKSQLASTDVVDDQPAVSPPASDSSLISWAWLLAVVAGVCAVQLLFRRHG